MPLTSSNNTQIEKDNIVKKTSIALQKKTVLLLKIQIQLVLFILFGFEIQRHLICIYLDNQHDLKRGNQRISLKHQLLQSHRNSTNVLREQTLNLATTRKRRRESQNNLYRDSPTQQNQPWTALVPGQFVPHLPQEFSLTLWVLFQEQQQKGAALAPLHTGLTNRPSFPAWAGLGASPASPCDLHRRPRSLHACAATTASINSGQAASQAPKWNRETFWGPGKS